MGKHIQIHLTPEQRTEIEERIRSTSDRAVADCLRAILYRADGRSRQEIAGLLQIRSLNTVTHWLRSSDGILRSNGVGLRAIYPSRDGKARLKKAADRARGYLVRTKKAFPDPMERENAWALFKEVLNQVWEESESLPGKVDEKQLRAYQRIYVLVEGAVKGMLAEELDEAQMEGLLEVMDTLAAGIGVSDSDVETATRRLLRAGVNIFRPLSGTSEVFLEESEG